MDNYNSTANFHIAVIKDKSLSYLDKIVYIVLCSHADNEARECSPKVATIAEEASCSPRAVHKSLNNLEKHGVVSRKRRFVDHRQISSLYKIIAGMSQQNFPDENSTLQTNTYFEGRTECSDMVRTEFTDEGRTVCRAMVRTECSDTVNNVQSLNTLRIFNNSLKGEACLPALAEKESSLGNPEERTSQEETKNSLTGEALLPSSQSCEPKEEQEKPHVTESTQDSTTENPVIKAECTETHTDTEKPEVGACLPALAELEEKTLTQDEKLRRYYELRRKCEEEHRKAEAEACLPAPAENETTPEEPKDPQTEGSTLPDYLIQQYRRIRQEQNIVDFRPEDTLANGLQKFMTRKRPVINAECDEAIQTPVAKSELADKTLVAKTEPIETGNTPVVEDRHVTKSDNAPKPTEASNPPMVKDECIEHQDPTAIKSQPMEVSDPPVAVDGHMNADNASKPAETSNTPVAKDEPPAPHSAQQSSS